MLAVAVQNAVASTLVDDAPHLLHGWEGSGPPLGELLHGDAPAESRLPLRRKDVRRPRKRGCRKIRSIFSIPRLLLPCVFLVYFESRMKNREKLGH